MPSARLMVASIAVCLATGAVNAEERARQSQYVELICVAHPQSYEELRVFATDVDLSLPSTMSDQLQSATQAGFEAWMKGFCREQDSIGGIENVVELGGGEISVGTAPSDADDAAWAAARRADTQDAYQRYLDHFPEGRHTAQASWNLISKSIKAGSSDPVEIRTKIESVISELAKQEQNRSDVIEKPQFGGVLVSDAEQQGPLPPEEVTFTEEERIILDQLANIGFEQPHLSVPGGLL